jgi:hypothetical protein
MMEKWRWKVSSVGEVLELGERGKRAVEGAVKSGRGPSFYRGRRGAGRWWLVS